MFKKRSEKEKEKKNNKRPAEHNHYSSHMVSVSDGCLQGIDSCLERSPGGETREDERRNVKGDRQLSRPGREGGGRGK